MTKIFLKYFFLFGSLYALGQDTPILAGYNRGFQVVVDNDVFTSFYRDQYYTSGLFGYYRMSRITSDSVKRTLSLGISQRIYTPKLLSWERITSFDRPYAGTFSVEIGSEWYTPRNTYNRVHSELGILGPASGVSTIHTFWHRILGLIPPRGWEYEIGNMLIANVYLTHAREIEITDRFDFVPESNLAIGTLFNQVRQDFIFRLGKSKPLYESVHFNGLQLVENLRDFVGLREFYFFFGPSIEYNIYNSTIEGRLLFPSDIHVEEPVTWIIQSKSGLMMSWSRLDWRIFHYLRTKETNESVYHTYVGMHFNYRF